MPETDGADFGSGVRDLPNDISTQEAPPPLPPRSYVERSPATAATEQQG